MRSFDEVVDFVVVGSGGGSMCAGLVMRKAGKSVLILEKTDKVGGTTSKSGGVMWIPNNRFMKRDGVPDSYEQAMTYLDSVVGDRDDAPGATRERRQTYLNEAPRMVDFLVGQGIALDRVAYWPDYYDDRPGGSKQGRTVVAKLFNSKELGEWESKLRPGFFGNLPATLDEAMSAQYFKKSWASKMNMVKIGLRTVASKFTGAKWVSAGAALQGRMLQAALKAGIDIRLNSPVRSFLYEGDKVVGVVVEQDGKEKRIGASLGVLVNAGGFAKNQAMRDKYQPGTQARWSNAIEGDTGEMIMTLAADGAALAQMEEMVGYQTSEAPGFEGMYVKPAIQSTTAKPHAILVDQEGQRFMNEGGSYMLFCKTMLERERSQGRTIPSWGIFDSQFIDNYMMAGTMPGRKKPQAWFDEGYLRQADTLEELAKLIEVPADKLKATVERFNGFARAGRDEDFHRGERAYDDWLADPFYKGPSKSLGPIEKGPFYALPVVPGDVGTYGGVVTDVHARVLKEDGTPIPGLYATGVSTASVMGRAYPGAGSSVGPSFTWGFVAAKHAANLDNQAL